MAYSGVVRVERARYFLAAVAAGSLRRGAAKCGVSQMTLSRQITLLEEDLDVILLTRDRIGVRLTPRGHDMVEPLATLVAAEDAIASAAARPGNAYKGTVSIGVVPSIVEAMMGPILGELQGQYQDLRFTIYESNSTDIEARVLSGELDFGVISAPSTSPAPGLQRINICAHSLGIVVPTSHLLAGRASVSWHELEAWPLVTMRQGTTLWEMLKQSVPDAHIATQASSARTVRVMSACGAGVGIVSEMSASADIPNLTWIRIADANPVDLCLTHRRDALPSPSARLVRQLIREKATDYLATGIAR